jgi:carbonic anhydrase
MIFASARLWGDTTVYRCGMVKYIIASFLSGNADDPIPEWLTRYETTRQSQNNLCSTLSDVRNV